MLTDKYASHQMTSKEQRATLQKQLVGIQKMLKDFTIPLSPPYSSSFQMVTSLVGEKKTPPAEGHINQIKNKVRAVLTRANHTDGSILSISDWNRMPPRCHYGSERLSMRTVLKGKRGRGGSCC